MNNLSFPRKAKLAALTSLLAGGMALGSACSMADIRHNAVAGTLGFVSGYTADLWYALAPPADEFINLGVADDD